MCGNTETMIPTSLDCGSAEWINLRPRWFNSECNVLHFIPALDSVPVSIVYDYV